MTPEEHRLFDALSTMLRRPLEDQLWLLTQAAEATRLGSDAVSLSIHISGTGTVRDHDKKAA